jgi:Na+-translocating ferredoxin:NAD+ oxidoreductase RnfA subunit
MSPVGIVFILVFTNNVALDAAFGVDDLFERRKATLGEALAVLFLGLLAGFISSSSFGILSLFDAESATAPVSIALMFIASRGLEAAAKRLKPGSAPKTTEAMGRIETSGIVYAIGLVVSGSRFGVAESAIAGLAAAAGYFAATAMLRKITRRASLEDVPSAFRGKALLFVNAGLIALAFTAFDSLAASLFRGR